MWNYLSAMLFKTSYSGKGVLNLNGNRTKKKKRKKRSKPDNSIKLIYLNGRRENFGFVHMKGCSTYLEIEGGITSLPVS